MTSARVPFRARILAYLEANCRGAANARTKRRIALDLFGDAGATRRVEHVIEKLVKTEFQPICSSCDAEHGCGYFLAVTSEEIERYMGQLKSRRKHLDDRLNSLTLALVRLRDEEYAARRAGAGRQEEMFG